MPLVRRAGELGLLGISVPEEYGGLDLDKVSALVVSERIARSASLGAAYGAQANLCIMPIVLFGTDAQKAKYLPGLVVRRDDRRLRAERIGLGIRRARGPNARDKAGRRQLGPQRREDVDHQRRLRRRLHRLRAGRRRSVHRLHRRARVRRQVGQRRAQDGAARLVDDADPAAGREGAGGEPARRDRQGAQGRAEHAELRPLQAGRDVQRRVPRGDRRSGEVCEAAEAVRPCDRGFRRHQVQAW